MNLTKLEKTLQTFRNKRVLVLGDVMLDEYIWGEVNRISPEAPVPVVESNRHTFVPGGATNVVNNIQALGGTALIAGVVGDDEMGRRLRSILNKVHVDVSGLIIDATRPTTVKTRVVAHNQQVVRIDRESKEHVSDTVSAQLLDYLAKAVLQVDAVVVSDYDKGVVSSSVISPLLKLIEKENGLITANPKPMNLLALKGCHVISMNQLEAERYSRTRISDKETLEKVGCLIQKDLCCKALLITRGGKGISVFEEHGVIHHIPAVEVEVFDVSGAGDTVISAATLALSAGINVVDSTLIGNYAAGAVIRKVGTATTTCAEILSLYRKDSQ